METKAIRKIFGEVEPPWPMPRVESYAWQITDALMKLANQDPRLQSVADRLRSAYPKGKEFPGIEGVRYIPDPTQKGMYIGIPEAGPMDVGTEISDPLHEYVDDLMRQHLDRYEIWEKAYNKMRELLDKRIQFLDSLIPLPMPTLPSISGLNKTGGAMMKAGLSLKRLLMAATSVGDLIALLKQIRNPPAEVAKELDKLEKSIAKYEAKYEQEYDESKLKPLLKSLLKVLKSVPAPTEDRPRTRIQRAIKMVEELLGNNVKGATLMASIDDVLKILNSIENPDEDIKNALKLAKQLKEEYETGGAQNYGHVVSVECLTKLLGMLDKMENKTEPVKKAIAMLKKMLGLDTEKIPEYGNLPTYGTSKVESAIKPGVYKARLIKAGEALDGKVWTKESLRDALDKGLFDGVPLNVITYSGSYGDLEYHLPEDSSLAGSISGNQVGFVKEPWWDDTDDAVYGYVYITDPSRRELIDTMLSEGVDAPGLSIYAEGTLDGDKVTKIDKVYSMDMVTFPAAGGQIVSQALTAAVKDWGRRLKAMQWPGAGGSVETVPESGKSESGTTPRISRQHVLDVLTSDNNILINDWLGSGMAEKYPDLVLGLAKKGYEWLKAHPNASDEDLWVYMHQQLKDASAPMLGRISNDTLANYLANKFWGVYKEQEAAENAYKYGDYGSSESAQASSEKTGGGLMKAAVLERFNDVERIARTLDHRVKLADTEAMIEQKLSASRLPDAVKQSLHEQLSGKILTAAEVDSFIKFQQKVVDDLAAQAAQSGVTLEGGLIEEEGDTLEDSLAKFLKVKEGD